MKGFLSSDEFVAELRASVRDLYDLADQVQRTIRAFEQEADRVDRTAGMGEAPPYVVVDKVIEESWDIPRKLLADVAGIIEIWTKGLAEARTRDLSSELE